MELKTNNDEFIKIDFLQYQLPDYVGFVNFVNSSIDNPEFYRILPNQIRKMQLLL